MNISMFIFTIGWFSLGDGCPNAVVNVGGRSISTFKCIFRTILLKSRRGGGKNPEGMYDKVKLSFHLLNINSSDLGLTPPFRSGRYCSMAANSYHSSEVVDILW